MTAIITSRVSDGAICIIVRGLDGSYEADDRRCWISVKKTGDINVWYEVYPDGAGTVKIGAGETGFVSGIITGYRISDDEVCGFEPNCSYDISLDISYTEDGKTKYSELTRTYVFGDDVPDIDGGGDGGNQPKAPVIEKLYAYQTSDGEKSVTVEWSISELTPPGIYGDEYGSEICINVGDKKQYILCSETDERSEGIRSIAVDGYGVYDVYIEAENDDGSVQSSVCSEKLSVEVCEAQGAYTLGCEWIDGYTLTSENFPPLGGLGHSFLCVSYPKIAAEDWKKFTLGINLLRKKAGLAEYGAFPDVGVGDALTAALFGHLYYAVRAIYDDEGIALEWDGSFPSGAPSAGTEISPEFISGLESAVWKAKELLILD